MVDNVQITAGTGTSIATDQVGSDHYQKVKLAVGAADVANLASVGSGVIDTGTLRIALATDSPGVMTVSQTVKDSSLSVTMASNQEAIGRVAVAHGTNPTAVTAGSAVLLASNRAGIPFFIGGHPSVICRAHVIAAGDAKTNFQLSPTITGVMVVTQLNVRADKENSTSVTVKIGFGAAGALTTPDATGVVGIIFHEELGAGDGHQIGNGAGIIGIGAATEELGITCGDPVGGRLFINYSYYTVES